jgi:hypothetical protein
VLRSMNFRRVRYWAAYLPDLVSNIPLTLGLHASTRFIFSSELLLGIRVADTSKKTWPEFLRVTDEALELVAAKDPLRYRRILKEIRTIVQMPVMTGAEYHRLLKICCLDLRVFVREGEKVAVKLLAAALVHEASHGHLHSRGITSMRRRNILRIERICYNETIAFAKRIDLPLRNLSDEELSPPGLRARLAWKPSSEP